MTNKEGETKERNCWKQPLLGIKYKTNGNDPGDTLT